MEERSGPGKGARSAKGRTTAEDDEERKREMMTEDDKTPITGFGDKKGNQFGLREIPVEEVKTHRLRAVDVVNKLIYAYEIGATMKDLDSVVGMWTSCVEAALINTDTIARAEEREACAEIVAKEFDAYTWEARKAAECFYNAMKTIRARGNKK
jgi:hypothetical protein